MKKETAEKPSPCQQATETQYKLGIKPRKQVQELRFSVPSSTEKMDYIVQVQGSL